MYGKVVYMTEPEHLEYKEYELPKPAHGAILVKVRRTNVCGSELHIWRGHHPAIKKGVLGHEMIGEVYELGEGIKTDYAGNEIKIGDRIVSTYFLTCKSRFFNYLYYFFRIRNSLITKLILFSCLSS